MSGAAGEGRVDLPGKLFGIEAGLRELAASGRVPGVEELERWIMELNDAAHMCRRTLLGELEKSCWALEDAAQALSYVGSALHNDVLGVGERMALLEDADSTLVDMENRVTRITGRPCRWGKHLGKARLRYTMLINDIAACVHVLAQYLLENWPEREEGRCAIARGAEPEAVDVCREWNRYADALLSKGYYHSSDANWLRGFVVGGRVQLRVGSAAGHLAEIDVKEGIVRYYDTDEPVNNVMSRLIAKYAGGRCELHDVNVGGGTYMPSVECKVSDVRRAARALAFATSMDYRINDRKMGIAEKMERECVEDALAERLGLSPEEVEEWRRGRGKL
jgi:hypothetical protein